MDRSSSKDDVLHLREQGRFFVGGQYGADGRLEGQMYVEYAVPEPRRHEWPVIFVPGGGQMGANWWATPDHRDGWATHFLRQGYASYVVDVPARGRSAYRDAFGGFAASYDVDIVQRLWASPARDPLWPAARLHTQWVGRPEPGDPIFDQFMAAQFISVAMGVQEALTRDALLALLNRIGPAVLVAHSQGGHAAWAVADQMPDQVVALVELEPGPSVEILLPPVFNEPIPVPWGLTTVSPLRYDPPVIDTEPLRFEKVAIDDKHVTDCWLQAAPARRLPYLAQVRILLMSSEASYNTLWDIGTSRYLTQAGVEHDFVRLEEIGIHGNGHFFIVEQNSNEIADVVLDWLQAGSTVHGRCGADERCKT